MSNISQLNEAFYFKCAIRASIKTKVEAQFQSVTLHNNLMPPLKLTALLLWYFTTLNDCSYCCKLNYTTVTNNIVLLYAHSSGNPGKHVSVPSRIPSANEGTFTSVLDVKKQ